jgi:hypothetical protein
MAYTAVDNSILTSSILMEDLPTRWLWTVMLILADQTRETQGVVDCPVDRLAQLANLTVAQTRHAIERLSSPDEKSRSKEDEGRRIVACETVEGFETRKWRLVNWSKYKDEIRKAQMAAASRRYRNLKKIEPASSTVINRHQGVILHSLSTPTPTPSPTPAKNTNTGTGRFAPPTLSEVRDYIREKGLTVDAVAWLAHYESNGWKVGKNPMKNWKAAIWTWTRERT